MPPRGVEIRVHGRGFDFEPYVIRTPVLGALRVPLRYLDSVRIDDDGCMIDRIDLRFLGIRVGTVEMRLRPA